MSQNPTKRYQQERDIEPFLNLYSEHVGAMTVEGLHAKSDIAAELAWRDHQIAELKAEAGEARAIAHHASAECDTLREALSSERSQREFLTKVRTDLLAKVLQLEATHVETAKGVGMIAAERERQVAAEGWTPEHDGGHDREELVRAAVTYAQPWRRTNGIKASDTWPWDDSWWKPSTDPIRNLTKAGALIAAEIDRLQRARRNNR